MMSHPFQPNLALRHNKPHEEIPINPWTFLHWGITDPEVNQQLLAKGDLGKVFFNYRSLVWFRFLRYELGIKDWKVSYSPRGFLLDLVEAEASLWGAVFRMIERLQSFGRLPTELSVPIPAVLAYLLAENSLILFQAFQDDSVGGSSKAVQLWQAQNVRLRELENPFTAPIAKQLIDSAILLAGEQDTFRSKIYPPVWKQRSALVNLIKNHPREKIGTYLLYRFDKPPLRQGRKR
jgi:hypothetical protein